MSLLCKSPYMKGVIPCGCGQCKPCLINRRRTWTHRLMLEAFTHEENAFVTLTYEKEPEGATLVPSDVQEWLKRLRFRIAPRRVRYYLAGEYGETTERPHYHVALFGYPTCSRGRTEHRLSTCCEPCNTIKTTWGHGGVDLGELELKSAQYIAGYVTKKMTNPNNPRVRAWLKGRHPEFSRMSLRPGIGAFAMDQVVASIKTVDGLVKSLDDVPNFLQHGMKKLPLGRYLRRQLREKLGRSKDTPRAAIETFLAELQGLRQQFLQENSDLPSAFKDPKSQFMKENVQRFRNFEAREKIFGQQRSVL